uniref:Contactin associated protein family member 5 n=1 Tax=Monodelphis domestica TaxID=13616 RepID=A0A5F8GIQ6_MONDO
RMKFEPESLNLILTLSNDHWHYLSVYVGGYDQTYTLGKVSLADIILSHFCPLSGPGGWSPVNSNAQQWLQIDLGNRVEITAVATQGRYGSSDWVTSYILMFSDTGRNWKQYKQEDNIWTFSGNTNADSIVHHKFLHSVKARFIRFVPMEWNPNGKIGMRVEVYGCSYKSDVADFDGRSSLLYRFNQKLMSTFKDVISLKFKSMQGDGVLFHGEGQHGDYITLELQKGKLSLHINLGDSKLRFSNSQPSVILGSLLDDQHWHSVLIERFNKQVNFTVDKHTQHFRAKGDGDYLDIDYEGNVTFSCSEPQIVPITFVNSSSSYLLLPGTPQIDGLSVSFQFRTWNRDGLLLSTALSEDSGILLLYLEDGLLRLVIQKMTERSMEIPTGSNLNDGLWHSVSINARRNRITLTLDNDAASAAHETTRLQIYSGNSYYFGGCPDNFTESQCLNPIKAFQGCMRLIFIDNQPKDLISVQQGSLGNFSDLHIDLCSIKDRCLPNYCEHGGTCAQSWATFYCNCSDTGYTGATCHNSIYEQSCEAYRHKGNTSGFFHIDPDGSGPLDPLYVYCNITEDKIWTAVQHNNTELIRVRGAHPKRPYVMYFNYSSSMEQLEAMINGAEYCEQETIYHCKKSRLLNTPNGMPFTWWIGRANEKHPYWGGSLPGVQQCACGLEESCLDMRHFCNWHFWNAPSFNTEASYLHFPTFHAEFSADISFFFKTTALSGIFLENLGIKDFIRLEISSPSEVTFALDVGNGPMELTVLSPTPLNDNQWHYVQAERNLKQTLLQVDDLPAKILETQEDGHFRLQLNSQLFVGGTASRQKGFLGCIRSLHLNGQKLDLEEKALVTPGVKPGCPGHCSSYGNFCHNGGKCVEKYNGYLCDCTNSPYEGPFCKKEVSAIFEAGTSVTYVFQEPYPVTKNTSLSSSAIYVDSMPSSKENIAFNFLTGQTPCLLLYIDSYFQDYLAVLLSKNGNLQVRYQLSKERVHVCTFDAENFANRRMHHVKINRDGKELTIQVLHLPFTYLGLDVEVSKVNTIGFVGCLSSVQYNHIAPLKAALRHPSIAPVSVKGILVEANCRSVMEADINTVTTHGSWHTENIIKILVIYNITTMMMTSMIIMIILMLISAIPYGYYHYSYKKNSHKSYFQAEKIWRQSHLILYSFIYSKINISNWYYFFLEVKKGSTGLHSIFSIWNSQDRSVTYSCIDFQVLKNLDSGKFPGAQRGQGPCLWRNRNYL